jgi:hypothetical protein
MESFHTSDSRAADALLNSTLSDDDVEDAPPDDEEALQLARIEECRQEALREEDSLESSLGGLTSGLMKFSVRYEQNITKLHEQPGVAIHDSPELIRSMTTYLNLLRQVDRFVNLKARLAENRQSMANVKSQRRAAIVPGSITDPTRRNKR